MSPYNPALRARPTSYRGVQMRSRLEARVAAGLDIEGVAWKYEPECFANENGQYLPDFEWSMDETHQCFFEVKPPLDFEERDVVFARMEIIRSSIPTASLHLIEAHPCGDIALLWMNVSSRWILARSDWPLGPIS